MIFYKGHNKIKGDAKAERVRATACEQTDMEYVKFDLLETDFSYEHTFSYVHALICWKIIVHIPFPRYV